MSALVIFPYIARALSVVQCAGIPTNLTVHYLAEARIGDAATDQGAPLYELRVGSPTPPHSGQTADFKWVSGREEVFVVSYDPALYRVSLTVGGTTVVYESPPPAPSVGDIVLLLTAVKPQSSVRVHSLFLNGQALGVEAKAWGPGNGHAGLHIRGDGWSRVTLVGVIQMTFASGHPNAPRNSQLAVELALAMNSETQPGPPDADGDGVADGVDNCPDVANSDQADLDQDGHGDACDEDIDGDGMPNDWEQANGLDERDPADASLDSDGDGLSNLAEYMAGTNPNDPNSALWARIVVRSPPQISWDSVAGRSYSIWRATTLKHGMAGFEKIASGIAATPPVNTFVDYTATGLTHYYRIQLEPR